MIKFFDLQLFSSQDYTKPDMSILSLKISHFGFFSESVITLSPNMIMMIYNCLMIEDFIHIVKFYMKIFLYLLGDEFT